MNKRLIKLVILGLLVFMCVPNFSLKPPVAHAEVVSVSCSGTSGSPTAVTEADLAGDDVTFADTGGDGYCVLDEAISAASVVINTGVTITHTAADVDGITITTTGNFEVQAGAYVNADSKGCQGAGSENGSGPNGSNVCGVNTAGFGDGQNGGAGVQGAGHGGTGGLGSSTTHNTGGLTYDSATAPVLFGSSGGNNTSAFVGGSGGGIIRLSVSGTFTNNGVVSADGGTPPVARSDVGPGGGSGGSIYITTGAIAGTTGTFSADGGAGANADPNGGGGGGGRIAITYTSSTFSFDASDFTVAGGSGPDTAADGTLGTVYVKDTDDGIVNVYYGFTYATDYNEAAWTFDPTVVNQNCDVSSDTSLSLTAPSLTLRGIITCNNATLTSFNFSASSSFAISNNTTISINQTGSTVDFNIPAGNNQTWSGFAFTGGGQGYFTVNDAIDITLTGTSIITANTQWTNLTNLTIDSGSTISADFKGCQGAGTINGYGPTNPGNVCTENTAGFGDGNNGGAGVQGAGHGGTGGLGSSVSHNTGGLTYDSATAPVLFGSSGGNNTSGYLGGNGGGVVRLSVTGTFTNNGTISADGSIPTYRFGSDDNVGPGGGSGGSIYVTIGTISGTTGTFSADGGPGYNGNPDGGGGGGGRIAFEYGADSTTYLADLAAATVAVGGSGPDTAADGVVGTLSKVQVVYLASIAITDNSSYTNDSTPVITITESGATPTDVAFSCNGGSNWSDWIAYPGDDAVNDENGPSFNITSGATGCSATNELKTISAKIRDGSSTSSTVTDTTTYDTVAPTVSNVTATNVNGTYGVDTVITVTVQFDNSMAVTGTPQLLLDFNGTDRQANYASVLTDTLSFTYTIVNGDNKTDLDYAGTDSLTLNTGTIKDLAGNNATLTLATPGAAGSLGANKNINISTNQAPTVASVSGVELTNGTGGVTVSFIVDDPDDDNTLQALVQYNIGAGWNKATLSETAGTGSTYGQFNVENDNTYQVGNSNGYLVIPIRNKNITARRLESSPNR